MASKMEFWSSSVNVSSGYVCQSLLVSPWSLRVFGFSGALAVSVGVLPSDLGLLKFSVGVLPALTRLHFLIAEFPLFLLRLL
jgi:hypothetical protein